MLMLLTTDPDALRAMSRGTLNPRLIDAGKHAGSYVIPARVKADRAHADKLVVLERLTEAEIDIDAAWPAPIEE